LAIVKSKLLKKLSASYPNFLKKDLEKFTNIVLKEIKQTLKRGERVELRGFGVFSQMYKRLVFQEILRQAKRFIHQKKKQFTLKWLRICLRN
tara:strand:- start:155 stop:430 length:276 start_codon:yes stop_codon:yes gene_type:complete